MATKSLPAPEGRKTSSENLKDKEKPAAFWIIPVVTALTLASIFCLYYFVYVGAQRQYLANRNFRALALLGEQLQQRISIHTNILEFCSRQNASKENTHRKKLDLKNFYVLRPEDKNLPAAEGTREALKDYLKYLAPTFELAEVSSKDAPSSLQVRRRDDNWELILRHVKGYQGSLKIQQLMEPLVGSLPFDDILLVSQEGTVVYQSKQAGPRFTTLGDLLHAQIGRQPDKEENKQAGKTRPTHPNRPIEENEDPEWRKNPMHSTDVLLAGTQYKLFLQPILVSPLNAVPMTEDQAKTKDEPAIEWVVCGLRTSTGLDWEAYSLSFTFFIWLTAGFFIIWASYKVLKIFFMNERERLRLRELLILGFSLIILTSLATLCLLQFDFRANDDTERQLQSLSQTLSKNIGDELQEMKKQLIAWCGSVAPDLKGAQKEEIVRTVQTGDPNDPGDAEVSPAACAARPHVEQDSSVPPRPDIYPFVNNGFWTDDDGHQVVKWSTTHYATPMIDVSQLPGSSPPDIYLDRYSKPLHFASSLPPNKLEYLATLGMKTRDCVQSVKTIPDDILNGSAFLTAKPLSLIDTILPYGYGFALVDQSGYVMFHSDKTRNGRENFLLESESSKELYAAIYGHRSLHSLPIKYRGVDHRAVVVPVGNVSQAPWSLVVFKDLTSIRTLNLQVMAMSFTLLFIFLAVPGLLAAIWYGTRRPRFAPEWAWPNQRRLRTYFYLICVYVALIILFLLLGIWISSEGMLIACGVFPYAAWLLTLWCFRVFPAAACMRTPAKGGNLVVAGAAASAGALILSVWILCRARLKIPELWSLGAIAAVPFFMKPRRHMTGILNRWRNVQALGESSAGTDTAPSAYRKYWLASVLLWLLLIGVLMPMALFRISLNVERRLQIKQAQKHLASSLSRHWNAIVEQRGKEELGDGAWCALKKRDAWSKIVPHGLPTGEDPPAGDEGWSKPVELYSGWFRSLVYLFHHDYNELSAEMLGVVEDWGNFPDWSWENTEPAIVLHWKGAHPKVLETPRHDLTIRDAVPAFSRRDAVIYSGIAFTVILVIGCLVWALARKVFRFETAPLKITGRRQVSESLRDGKHVVILLPVNLQLEWQLEEPKWTLDLKKEATGPHWAENLDLSKIPLHRVIEIRHFEFSTGDKPMDDQKYVLLERLKNRGDTQLAIVMNVPVSTEDYRRMYPPPFEVVDLREEPFRWWEMYQGPAQDMIWEECWPMAALWPLGAQVAKDFKDEPILSQDTIATEILERADPYYRLIWKECSKEQKFVLSQLAEDGLPNPGNGRAVRQMVRRGLITKEPQFRIMNESFRRFVRSATTSEMEQEWLRESRRSGWGKTHGAFFATMTILGVFLLATQNALWQSAAAYVTTGLGTLGTFAKLFDSLRARGASEKP